MCHRPPRKQSKTTAASDLALAWIGALLVLMAGCASDGPTLLPVGDHDAEVGLPLVVTLTVVEPGAGGLTWTLVDGPTAMRVEVVAGKAQLVWLATAFELALTQPGQPRAPGPAQVIRVRACDVDGACAQADGSVRAVPTPP